MKLFSYKNACSPVNSKVGALVIESILLFILFNSSPKFVFPPLDDSTIISNLPFSYLTLSPKLKSPVSIFNHDLPFLLSRIPVLIISAVKIPVSMKSATI